MEFNDFADRGIISPPEETAVNAVSTSYVEFRAFMRKYGRISASEKMYHFLEMFDQGGPKYRFDDDLMVQFFELVDACRREGCILHMLERINEEPAGIMIDFDRKQEAPAPSIFTPERIARLATMLGEIVSSTISAQTAQASVEDIAEKMLASAQAGTSASVEAPHIAPPHKPFHVFVIKRSRITRDPSCSLYKDGIHMLVPDIWLSKGSRQFIVERVRSDVQRIFDDVQHADKMVDRNSANVQAHLLGSCKVGGTMYNLVHAAEISKCVGASAPTTHTLSVDALRKGYSAQPDEGGIKINLTYELCLSRYMPTFRGQPTWLQKRIEILPDDRIAKIEIPFARINTGQLPETQMRSFEDQIAQLIGTDPEAGFICDLLNALPIEYARDYTKWIGVLMAVVDACAVRRHDNYKILAQNFSMRAADKYDAAAFERQWSALTRRAAQREVGIARITMRSLEFWVRIENPVAYEEAKRKSAHGFLVARIYENNGALDNNTIAEILYRMLRGLCVVDTDAPDRLASNDWFEFVMPTSENIQPGEIYKWRRSRVPHYVYNLIPTIIHGYCRDVLRDIYARAERATDDAQKKQYTEIAKMLRGSMLKLKSDNFQEGTIRQARHLLYVRGFVESLDTQRFVIGVGNGVLEFLEETDIKSRATEIPGGPRLIRGYHELRVSRFTDVDYVPFDEANPYVRDILQAYHDIYVEPDACEFMLMYLSTWLDSCDVQRTLVLLGGGGSNGKTWSVYFPQAVLGGKYVKVLKMQLLTEEHEKAREANSALMQLKDIRGGYFDEANEGDCLNPARIKSIVTPGQQTGRELYSREEQFRNTANSVAISNYDFVLNATDNGTWDRILFYQCKARFVAAPDSASPYERLKRAELTSEWPFDTNYRRAMLSILVHYRLRLEREFQGQVRRIPIPTITMETTSFRMKQDPISRFIIETMVRSPASTARVDQIVDRYVKWYQEIVGTRPKVANLATVFQNSMLGEYIRCSRDASVLTESTGAAPSASASASARSEYTAFGVRLRDKGDRLGDGETFFG